MKGFRPNKEGLQTFGYRLQASFITGFGGKTAPPFERFFQGGDTDLRGFDIRAAGPVALISDKATVTLTNPDGNPVLLNPNNANAGYYSITIPVQRMIYPGGDTSLVGNMEYRIPIVGPVTIAIFDDMGMNMAVRQSQLRLSDQLLSQLNTTPFGCPSAISTDVNGQLATTCQGQQFLKFGQNISPLPHTNYQLRMSTGMELQVILPVVNAPFRLYYAYNPLRVNSSEAADSRITRNMFPYTTNPDTGALVPTAAGNYTYLNAIAQYTPNYHLLEPRKTLRFTVATTF
jgi:outer membrane protein insertion porin family